MLTIQSLTIKSLSPSFHHPRRQFIVRKSMVIPKGPDAGQVRDVIVGRMSLVDLAGADAEGLTVTDLQLRKEWKMVRRLFCHPELGAVVVPDPDIPAHVNSVEGTNWCIGGKSSHRSRPAPKPDRRQYLLPQ